jgi:hypothetical protein
MMSVERAKEVKASILWADVCEEINKQIHYLTQRLRSCTRDELEGIQREINAHEKLKQLPDNVIDRGDVDPNE